MKINWKKLLISLAIPLGLGGLAALLSGGMSDYGNMIQPPLSPPGWVFPVVWTILYLLMGVSAYIVDNSDDPNSDKAMRFYYIQFLLNLLWTPVFFLFKLKGGSVILTILLLIFVLLTAYKFYKINKVLPLQGYDHLP